MKDQPKITPPPPARDRPPNASAALAARIGTLAEVSQTDLQADWTHKK